MKARVVLMWILLAALCGSAAIVGCRLRPREFVSTCVLRPRSQDPQALHDAERSVLSDYSLISIIERENLYPEERKRSGMSAAVRKMRDQGIRMQEGESLGPVIVLSFRYPVARQAQAAAHDLSAALQAAIPCEVLVDASTPQP